MLANDTHAGKRNRINHFAGSKGIRSEIIWQKLRWQETKVRRRLQSVIKVAERDELGFRTRVSYSIWDLYVASLHLSSAATSVPSNNQRLNTYSSFSDSTCLSISQSDYLIFYSRRYPLCFASLTNMCDHMRRCKKNALEQKGVRGVALHSVVFAALRAHIKLNRVEFEKHFIILA